MPFAVLVLVLDYRRQIDVFHAFEDILLDFRILFGEVGDEFFHLFSFGRALDVEVVVTSVFGELAGALQEGQSVVVPPGFDVLLPHEIHRTDEFHPLEVGALDFGHHRLHLRAVQHPHQNSLDDVVVVMPEGDLVTAQFFGFGVEVL